MLLQKIGQLYWLAETRGHLAEVTFQSENSAQSAERGFSLLFFTVEFTEIGAAFDKFFVTDIYRDECQRPHRFANKGFDGHAEHAVSGFQQPPGATASTFNEVFQRHAESNQLGDVGAHHRAVQAVVAETAADEERATATQNAANERNVEIVAGSDIRDCQVLVIDHVGQQQVVDVASMTGDVD